MHAATLTPPSVQQDALSADIHLLGDLLGQTIRRLAGEQAFALEEDVRVAAKTLRNEPSVAEARQLRDRLDQLDLPALRTLIRAFSVYFDLVNLSEQQARVRAIRSRTLETAPTPMSESPEAALQSLREAGIGAAEVAEHLARSLICPVFTAHPSEARRRTILEKLDAISAQLDRLEYTRLLPAERDQAVACIAEEIEAFWLTDTVRGVRPTVLDEVRHGLEVVEGTLLDVVPRVYRDVEAALARTYPDHQWDVPSFLRFGSWIGGDRDGNPNVTHGLTAEAVRLQLESILQQYLKRVAVLGRQLSHSGHFADPGPAFHAALERESRVFPEAGELRLTEPFRAKCRLLAAKLQRTLDYVRTHYPSWSDDRSHYRPGVYASRRELRADVVELTDGLRQAGATGAAAGAASDLLRLVDVFGMHMFTLDIRQHSGRHEQALDEIFRWAGVHTKYASLPSAERFAVLVHELQQARPLVPSRLSFTPEACEVVQTFRTVAAILEQQCPEAIDTYIISSTTEAAHLLEVLLLAREARLFQPTEGISRIQIVPLFEALAPLRSGTAIMETLFSLPIYRKHVELRGNIQEVMIGYSDSNKESGFLQSAWALYRAQCDLAELGRKHGITVQFFHGRGGSVGRGGGPANRAILAQPRRTVDGRLRLTEQGEMIADRYGHHAIAERHLAQVVNAVLRSSFPAGAEDPDPAWEAELEGIADSACKHYRAFVYETPEFLTYFEQATPIAEISQLKIGSRPARRGTVQGIDHLRAIPWVFSWMQNRHTLPGWFGLGSAISDHLKAHPEDLSILQAMYRRWPFWKTLIDSAQMILAKADLTIARLYADLVEDQALANRMFHRVEAEYQLTVAMICQVTGQSVLLEQVPVLRRSIQQRNPYVDPLSFIQLVMLRRLRAGDGPREELLTGVLESINGLASGLKNTG